MTDSGLPLLRLASTLTEERGQARLPDRELITVEF
jgi:hypothetical protein